MTNISADKTNRMLFSTEEEIFNKLIESDHPFRKLNELFDFTELAGSLAKCYSELGTTGIAVEKGFKALLVQFWEDYSDREMEMALRYNIVVRWFCGFGNNGRGIDEGKNLAKQVFLFHSFINFVKYLR